MRVPSGSLCVSVVGASVFSVVMVRAPVGVCLCVCAYFCVQKIVVHRHIRVFCACFIHFICVHILELSFGGFFFPFRPSLSSLLLLRSAEWLLLSAFVFIDDLVWHMRYHFAFLILCILIFFIANIFSLNIHGVIQHNRSYQGSAVPVEIN